MKILGIDTSTAVASVAVISEGDILGEITISNQKTHAEKIMVMVDQLLCLLKLNPKDLDAIAVGVGPGSFTGVRIGVTTAKGLAHSLACPLYEISSLEALSHKMVGVNIVCPMMDARRETVFTALYGEETMLPEQIHIDVLLERCKAYDSVGFIGDGAYKHQAKIKEALGEKAIIQAREQGQMSAAGLCLLAYKSQNQKSYEDVSVVYLRKTEAERNYEK
jgi:tRNA threonylcarbamoyladenosine biosynthesis protein TsaB